LHARTSRICCWHEPLDGDARLRCASR
jgi:hypothetical protein